MRIIDGDNGPRLGIPTGLNPRSFNGTDTVSIRKTPGYVVGRDGLVSEWYIEKYIESDGEMIALGPWPGENRSWDPDTDGPAAWTGLLAVVDKLAGSDRKDSLGGFYLPAFRILEDGGLFVCPLELAAWVRDNNPESDTISDWQTWNHPDLEGADGWSFSLGMLVWRRLVKTDPCQGETGEDRRERIRREVIPQVASAFPGIDPADGDVIDRSLAPGRSRRSEIAEWRRLVNSWQKTGLPEIRNLGTEADRSAGNTGRYASAEKALRFGRWARRSLWKYALFAAILGGAAAFLSAPVGNALKAPVTEGMSPMEVAGVYYNAMDRMDSETMDDCLARGIGKADKQHVDMVFVTGKVRQGYEGLAPPPGAAEWLAESRPELPEGVWPWGITDLEIDKLPDGRIRARYRLWYPGGAESPAVAEGEAREDILDFREGRRSWEISGIERRLPELN